MRIKLHCCVDKCTELAAFLFGAADTPICVTHYRIAARMFPAKFARPKGIN